MAEFERYKKNTRKEELEYEAALRAKPIDQLTPYEIGLLADWNESFYGDELDEKKLRQYAEVKDLAVQFLSAGKNAVKLFESAPDRHKANAVIYVDLAPYGMLRREEKRLFQKLIGKADDVSICAIDGPYLRYSFGVVGIWKKTW